jgi:hypothetical protein
MPLGRRCSPKTPGSPKTSVLAENTETAPTHGPARSPRSGSAIAEGSQPCGFFIIGQASAFSVQVPDFSVQAPDLSEQHAGFGAFGEAGSATEVFSDLQAAMQPTKASASARFFMRIVLSKGPQARRWDHESKVLV